MSAKKTASPVQAGGLPQSFFISDKPHPAPVKLANGETHTLHFLDLTQEQFREFHEARQSADAKVRKTAAAQLIAHGLCGADGTPALTVEQAAKLKPAAMNAILGKLLEVNDIAAGN